MNSAQSVGKTTDENYGSDQCPTALLADNPEKILRGGNTLMKTTQNISGSSDPSSDIILELKNHNYDVLESNSSLEMSIGGYRNHSIT